MKKTNDTNILRALVPRKKIIEDLPEFSPPPAIRTVKFKTRYFKVIRQLAKWVLATLFFILTLLWDKLTRRDTAKGRGIRLRKILEWMGGTMVKIGQQLSLRIDLLPYAMCNELNKMLDQQPPISTQKAIQCIESATGRKLSELFSAFDPTPIGSASIACVFQATLKDGKSVAIKVRRPGIGELFMADFMALDILCILLELFTILRPGFTKTFRHELREALLEELNFSKEARYQELFRQSAKKSKVSFIEAPKVHFEFSTGELLIMDLIEGVSLSEVLAIVEQKDEKGLAILKERKIKPKKVARRLLWVSHMAMVSELFFHSDPNPANVFVQENSKLVFIDFGSCGSFNYSQKRFLRQINYYQFQGDPEGMARSTLGLLQPLPPIDLEAFAKDVENIYRTTIYAMADKNAQWWERTTAVHWISFMKLAMKYRIPLPMSLIHVVRATMLYDTISARLHKKIDFYKAFRKYEKYAGKIARKRLRKTAYQTLAGNIDPTIFLKVEEVINTGSRLFHRLQWVLDAAPLRFGNMVSKGYYFIGTMIRFGITVITITGLVLLGVFMYNLLQGTDLNLSQAFNKLLTFKWFHLLMVATTFILIRRILFRFDDKDS